MTDPYQILGVSRDASDDEIKKAYRTLSRKYHPDANINNPNKDQAEAKFKEVQQAYQQIMKEREYGSSGSYGAGGYGTSGGYGSYGSGQSGDPFGGFWGDFGGGYRQQAGPEATDNEDVLHLRAAANFIGSGHYQEALNVLNDMKDRSAQWYYYSAMANSGLGNNVAALEHAKTAYQMNPNNMQYQVLLQRLAEWRQLVSDQAESLSSLLDGRQRLLHEALHCQSGMQPLLRRKRLLRWSGNRWRTILLMKQLIK